MLNQELSQKAVKWVKSNPLLSAKQHQLSGIEWCLKRELEHGYEGGILADEMGLGKTILMIATIVANPKPHTLIVVPPALLNQWKDAIERFAPLVNCIGKSKSGSPIPIFKNTTYKEGGEGKCHTFQTLFANNVWITSYGMISKRKDEKWCSPLWQSMIEKSCKKRKIPNWEWDRIIYDEAHHLRNCRSKKYKGMKELGGKIKWFVTGTPIQNVANDLHSLLMPLDIMPHMVNRDTIRKFVLGRTKSSVGIRMPKKSIFEIPVLLSSKHENEYNMAIQIHNQIRFQDVTVENVDRIIAELFEGRSMFATMTAARQCCLIPEIVTNKAFHFGIIEGLDVAELKQVVTHTKLTAVAEHISTHKEEGSKLVFTHYRSESDRLNKLLRLKGLSVSVLDGRTKSKERKTILSGNNDRFVQKVLYRISKRYKGLSSDIGKKIAEFLTPDVLLIQIKSGSEGLNLQAYNNVYFTSPHWNPAVEDQAVARAHRIGQTKNVNVYHFVTKLEGDKTCSMDEYCQVVQAKKRELMNMVLDNSEKL